MLGSVFRGPDVEVKAVLTDAVVSLEPAGVADLEGRGSRRCLIGVEGEGWRQVTSELAFERSGPERFLSHLSALEEFAYARSQAAAIGRGR